VGKLLRMTVSRQRHTAHRMGSVLAWTILSTIAYALPSSAAFAADVINGATVYAQHCTFCHGSNGAGKMPEMPDFTRGDTLMEPDEVLFESVKFGKGVMPGFQGILSDDEIADSIAHVRTLEFSQFEQFDQPLFDDQFDQPLR